MVLLVAILLFVNVAQPIAALRLLSPLNQARQAAGSCSDLVTEACGSTGTQQSCSTAVCSNACLTELPQISQCCQETTFTDLVNCFESLSETFETSSTAATTTYSFSVSVPHPSAALSTTSSNPKSRGTSTSKTTTSASSPAPGQTTASSANMEPTEDPTEGLITGTSPDPTARASTPPAPSSSAAAAILNVGGVNVLAAGLFGLLALA